MNLSKYCFTYKNEELGIIYNSKNNKSYIFDSQTYDKIINEKDYSVIEKEFCKYNFFDNDDCIIEENFIKNNHMRIRLFTTLTCNAKCDYCYEKNIKGGLLENDILSKTIEFIKQQIKENEIINIHIEWFGGEPLLNIEPIKVISKFLKGYTNIKFTSSIVTNGSLLSPKIIDMLVNESNLKLIQISVDAIGEKFNKIKKFKFDAFCNIEENIKYIVKNYNKLKIIIRTNYTNDTINDVYNLIEYYGNKDYKHNLKISCFYVFDDSTLEDSIKSKEKYYETILFRLYKNGFLSSKEILPFNCKHCSAKTMLYYIILPNGNIFYCDRKFINPIGNVNQDFNSQKINSEINNNCLNCKFYLLCRGGCEYERKLGKSGCYYSDEIINAHLKLCLHIYKESCDKNN